MRSGALQRLKQLLVNKQCEIKDFAIYEYLMPFLTEHFKQLNFIE